MSWISGTYRIDFKWVPSNGCITLAHWHHLPFDICLQDGFDQTPRQSGMDVSVVKQHPTHQCSLYLAALICCGG